MTSNYPSRAISTRPGTAVFNKATQTCTTDFDDLNTKSAADKQPTPKARTRFAQPKQQTDEVQMRNKDRTSDVYDNLGAAAKPKENKPADDMDAYDHLRARIAKRLSSSLLGQYGHKLDDDAIYAVSDRITQMLESGALNILDDDGKVKSRLSDVSSDSDDYQEASSTFKHVLSKGDIKLDFVVGEPSDSTPTLPDRNYRASEITDKASDNVRPVLRPLPPLPNISKDSQDDLKGAKAKVKPKKQVSPKLQPSSPRHSLMSELSDYLLRLSSVIVANQCNGTCIKFFTDLNEFRSKVIPDKLFEYTDSYLNSNTPLNMKAIKYNIDLKFDQILFAMFNALDVSSSIALKLSETDKHSISQALRLVHEKMLSKRCSFVSTKVATPTESSLMMHFLHALKKATVQLDKQMESSNVSVTQKASVRSCFLLGISLLQNLHIQLDQVSLNVYNQ